MTRVCRPISLPAEQPIYMCVSCAENFEPLSYLAVMSVHPLVRTFHLKTSAVDFSYI
jgi:hypothetical protein